MNKNKLFIRLFSLIILGALSVPVPSFAASLDNEIITNTYDLSQDVNDNQTQESNQSDNITQFDQIKDQQNNNKQNEIKNIETEAKLNEAEDSHISLTPDKSNIYMLPKDKNMFDAISDVWHDAFNYNYGSELRAGTYMNFYVNNIFTKYDTLVYMYDNKCVSMLTLIPTKLTLVDGSVKDGYYIYAVGTKNEYRKNGISTLMLNYVDDLAKSQGKEYRILNPDETNPNLYNFYNKRGYEYIRYRRVSLSPEEVLELASDSEMMPVQFGLNSGDLFNCRKINLENKTGFIQWEENELSEVQKEYKLEYKNYNELYFGDWQYAIIRYGKTDTKKIVIKEFNIKDENKKAFFKTLSVMFPEKTLVFEIPDSDDFSNFFDKPYSSRILTMINFKNSEELRSYVRYPVYFNFGMD